MSKRRVHAGEDDAPANLTPEERRAQRRRDRAKAKAGHGPTTSSPWRKAAVIGIPAAVIAAIAIVLIVSNLPTPCIQFIPIANSTPQSPNYPTFPTNSKGGFSGTWCINSTPVYSTSFYLRITIQATSVAIPSLIGERTNYTAGTCDLPIHTQISPLLPGVVQLDSPWAYEYNLSMFFNVWMQTDSNVNVNSSFPNQPIIYQKSDLLGFSSNASDSITLFVDNQLSNAGPALDVTTLDYGGTTPSCLGKVYGTGHTILLTYGSSKTIALRPLLVTPTLSTGLADPLAITELFDGPAAHVGLEAPLHDAISKVQLHSFLWLVLRVGP